MPTTSIHFALPAAVALAFAAVAAAQDAPTPPAKPQEPVAAPEKPHYIQLRYPRDREYAIAFVDNMPIWLEQLVQHIDERHYPGFAVLMAGPDSDGSPDGARILESDLMAPWTRQLADIVALQNEAKAKGPIDEKKLAEYSKIALDTGFDSFLQSYVEGLHRDGRPTELTQKRRDNLLRDYRMRHGLACELQAWIDYVQTPKKWSLEELNTFFQDHPRYFGGGVKIAHILIQNRDAGTGILLEEEGRIRAAKRLSDVQAQLRPDGSNFEDLARRYSDDTRTGLEGGILEGVERFDQRLPTAICRAAWELEDGKVSDVIETQYGWHLVKRIEHKQRIFMLFSDATVPIARDLMNRQYQEDFLMALRKNHKIELKL